MQSMLHYQIAVLVSRLESHINGGPVWHQLHGAVVTRIGGESLKESVSEQSRVHALALNGAQQIQTFYQRKVDPLEVLYCGLVGNQQFPERLNRQVYLYLEKTYKNKTNQIIDGTLSAKYSLDRMAIPISLPRKASISNCTGEIAPGFRIHFSRL
jgi:hypothetical protein